MSEPTTSAKAAVTDGSPFAIPGRTSVKITVSVLFSICFLAFFLIIGIDMVRKHRTGELQESLRNLGNLAIKIPVVLFKLVLEAINFVWIWFTDLFRSEENKRRKKNKDPEVTLNRKFDSGPIIGRLAAKSGLTTGTEEGKGILATVIDVTEGEKGVLTTVTEKGKGKDIVTTVAAKGMETPKLVESDGENERTTKVEGIVVMDDEKEKEGEQEEEGEREKEREREVEEENEKGSEKEECSKESHERESHNH